MTPCSKGHILPPGLPCSPRVADGGCIPPSQFSSFDPDVCAMLRLRQQRIPVFFLSSGSTAPHPNPARQGLDAAINFALRTNLQARRLDNIHLLMSRWSRAIARQASRMVAEARPTLCRPSAQVSELDLQPCSYYGMQLCVGSRGGHFSLATGTASGSHSPQQGSPSAKACYTVSRLLASWAGLAWWR